MQAKNNTTAADGPLSTLGLAPAIIDRLSAEGVKTASAWRALGRKRLRIFGITAAMVRQIDALARGAAQ